MKRLDLADGVVLARPIEAAERVQAYTADNLMELQAALFSRYGIIGVEHGALGVSVVEDQPFLTDVAVQQVSPVEESRVRANVQSIALLDEAEVGDSGGVVIVDEIPNPTGDVPGPTPIVVTSLKAPSPRRTSGAALQLRVNPGFFVGVWGALHQPRTVSFNIDKGAWLGRSLSERTLFVCAMHTSAQKNPVELMPFGRGARYLQQFDVPRIVVRTTEPAESQGYALARVKLKRRGSEVVDVRSKNAAELRVDAAFEALSPELVSQARSLFSRPNIVSEISELLDHRRLQGQIVLTESAVAATPLFPRVSYEPAFRADVRQAQRQRAVRGPLPNPALSVTLEWNIYAVSATKMEVANDGHRVVISSDFDLTKYAVDPSHDPLFIQFNGFNYEIDAILSPNSLRTKTPLPATPTSDPKAWIHNGVEEFAVEARGRYGALDRQDGASGTSVAVPGSSSPSVTLRLPFGAWDFVLSGWGARRKFSTVVPVLVSKFSDPAVLASLQVVGRQRTPAYQSFQLAMEDANPFKKLQIGTDGKPVVDVSQLDRYVEHVRQETSRIQEKDVAFEVMLAPAPRVFSSSTFQQQIAVAYDVELKMYTKSGLVTRETRRVRRTPASIVREIAWLDLHTKRLRGAVATSSALTDLSENLSVLSTPSLTSSRVREGDLVLVTADSVSANNTYWKYEPRLDAVDAERLPVGMTKPYTAGTGAKGHWVRYDNAKEVFQPENLFFEFNRITGGADYQLTATPIGELGGGGETTVIKTDQARTLYNAELGFDFHTAMVDAYRTFSLLMEQVDPRKLDELVRTRMNEVRSYVERASSYGLPPSVAGPLEIAAVPGNQLFVGRDLKGVNQVNMRYQLKESRSPVNVDADFQTVIGTDQEASILVRNLPNLADLSTDAPYVTLEFSAGARGSDLVTIRYDTVYPSVSLPTVTAFAGLRGDQIQGAATYANTASHWGYLRPGNGGPEYFGPFEKEWPAGQVSNTQAHPFFNTSFIVNGNTELVKAASVQAITFQARNFGPDSVLDVRVRRVPTEALVPQRAFGLAVKQTGVYTGGVDPETDPFYYRLRIQPDEITILVEHEHAGLWSGKSFVVEWVAYDGPPNAADSGKNLFAPGVTGVITDRGRLASAPSSPQNGDYYYNTATSVPYIRRAGAWAVCTPLMFGRHVFSVANSTAAKMTYKVRDLLLYTSAVVERTTLDVQPVQMSFEVGGTDTVQTTPYSVWVKEGDRVLIEAPGTTSVSGTTYTFKRWETCATPDGKWEEVGFNTALDWASPYATPYLRATYA